jgi:hypothetical protein
MTLMDKFDEFMATYIRKTESKENPPKMVEDDLPMDESDISDVDEKFSMKIGGKPMTSELRRRMALTTPFYMKGLKKKCRDTFRSGFTFKDNETNRKPPKSELRILNDFNKRNQIHKMLALAKQDAHIYGDGFWLKLYINDQNKKKPDLSIPPKDGAEPYKLKRIDPERINKREYKNKYWKNKGVQHIIYEKKNSGFFSKKGKIYIHPDRIIRFKETDFAFSWFGISDMDILRHVVNSSADIDIATGEILKFFSYGIVNWTKEGADKNAMKQMRKIAQKHPHTFIGNEKYKLQVENLESIDPEPFYDHIIMSIAATLVMPMHVLKGSEIGQTTGAGVSFVDYQKDIKDSQHLTYKPELEKLYKELYKSRFTKSDGVQYRKFDYEIEFNPMYVGEMAEAEVDAKRSATAVNLKTAGVVDNEEARKYVNEGHIYLDPDKKIKQPDKTFKEPIKQNPRTEQAVPRKEKEDKSDDNKLKSSSKMRELWDNPDDVDWENKGKREEFLQEKRIRAAKIQRLKNLCEKVEEFKNDKSKSSK